MTNTYRLARNHMVKIERIATVPGKRSWLYGRFIPFFDTQKQYMTEAERVDVSDYIANISRDLAGAL